MTVTLTDEHLSLCERAFWNVEGKTGTVEERARRGDDAFWAAMASRFPEVTTGDLDPLMTHRLTIAEEHAVAEWYSENGLSPEMNAALSTALRTAANAWLDYNHPANAEVTR